jgi:hypothetical protein
MGWTAATLLALSAVATQAQSEEEAPAIDPEAEALIRAWSERAAAQQSFRIEVLDTIDEANEEGQRLHFSHRRTATVSRPDKLRVETTGDINSRIFVFDGTTASLLDLDHNVYAELEVPGTLDNMMDTLVEQYNLTTPMADLLSSDPAEALLANVETGEHVGPGIVGEHDCHHLAFTQEDIDWQAWIDEGEVPQLRRLVITYKLLPGEPQYILTLQSSTGLSEVGDETFAIDLPEDALKIDFLPFEEEAGQDAAGQ